jgi:hypothetical protein
MSKEEIEAKVAPLLPPETLPDLKNSVWKERLKGPISPTCLICQNDEI